MNNTLQEKNNVLFDLLVISHPTFDYKFQGVNSLKNKSHQDNLTDSVVDVTSIPLNNS